MKQQILQMLCESDDYLSGEELSRRLNVSRTAVWKHISALRQEGYRIDSVTNKGYRLLQKPDRLSAEWLQRGSRRFVGTAVEVADQVDSTNEALKRRAAAGEPAGLLITAEEQTGGKGRFGRKWASRRGDGVYFSFLLRPDLPPESIASITLAAGFGVCCAVREYTGLDARIKWPNDVIIGRRKLCGILTEMTAQSDRLDYVVVGIGINVNQERFPEDVQQKATSLRLETGRRWDRNDFLLSVLQKLDEVMERYLISLSVDDMNAFKSLCATLGREVSVQRGKETLTGTAVDITPEGNVVVRCADGKEREINSGEVSVQGLY